MRSYTLALLLLLLAGEGRTLAAPTLAEVFKRVNPAVVEIHTMDTDVERGGLSRQVSVPGLGSGVLISPDGKILTAAHVVQTANLIVVEFLTGCHLSPHSRPGVFSIGGHSFSGERGPGIFTR